MMTSR